MEDDTHQTDGGRDGQIPESAYGRAFARLGRSMFRSRFRLDGEQRAYLNAAAADEFETEDYGWTLQPLTE